MGYMERVNKLVQEASGTGLPKAMHAHVLHDDWCPMVRGTAAMDCACDPDIVLSDSPERPKKSS